MAFTSKTYAVGDVIKSMEANIETAVTFVLRPAKDGKVYKGGTEYVDTMFTIGENRPANIALYARDVHVVRGLEDPNDPNNKFAIEKKEGSKEVVIGVSHNHSGGYGTFVKKFNAHRDGTFAKQFPKWNKEKYNPMFSERYPDTAFKDVAGKPYPDPLDANKTDCRSNLVLDFGAYANETYIPQHLRGKPKCVVKDFRTGVFNPKTNQIDYQLFLVDGRPVDETNAWKVFKSHCTLEEVYVTVSNTSKSKFGIATKQCVSEVVVNPREDVRTGEIAHVPNTDLLAKIAAIQKAKQEASGSTATPSAGASTITGATSASAPASVTTSASATSATTDAPPAAPIVASSAVPPAAVAPTLDPSVVAVINSI